MAKKQFHWVADGDEGDEDEGRTRPTRSERQAVPKQALAMAKTLVALTPTIWAGLELPELLIEELVEHARINPKARGAKKRQLRLVSRLLNQVDIDALEAALVDKPAARQDAVDLLVRWRSRLLAGGSDALTAFLDAYPHADRQQLRQRIAQAKKAADTPLGAKAGRALLDALKEATGFDGAGDDP